MTLSKTGIRDRGLLELDYSVWDKLVEQKVDKQLVASNTTAYNTTSFNVWYDTGSSVLVPRGTAQLKDVNLSYKLRAFASLTSWSSFSRTLRPNQVVPVNEITNKLVTLPGVTLQAQCGTGKTVMALAVMDHLQPAKTVVLVDQLDIAKQWSQQIAECCPGLSVQILSGDTFPDSPPKTNTRVLIIMAQSLMRQNWLANPLYCDLLIVDEAHVFSAPCFARAVANIDFCRSLALTATPDRKDNLEWVFQSILGTHIVKADAAALNAKVYTFEIDVAKPRMSDYNMAWCRTKKQMTWKAKCQTCEKFASFPWACGGNLPYDAGRVQWGTKLNVTSLQTAVAMDPGYLAWIHKTVEFLVEKDRQIMVFSGYRDHLDVLYAMGVKTFGLDKCGLFVGKAGKTAEKNRETAMKKQITYCTFGVANKALDVPWKDTAFYTTQISDVRQAKGRIERVVEGKKEPWLIDVCHTNIPIFRAMAYKRRKLYNESKCQIITIKVPRQSP